MIARIRFAVDDVNAVATLDDDLQWSCPEIPAIAETLNDELRVQPKGPSLGDPGHAAAYAAHEWLGGDLEIVPLGDTPEGIEY